MRKSGFTEIQVVGILKEGDSGLPLAELVRTHGISRATHFNWRRVRSLAGSILRETGDPYGTGERWDADGS